jgi:hypothetical protein
MPVCAKTAAVDVQCDINGFLRNQPVFMLHMLRQCHWKQLMQLSASEMSTDNDHTWWYSFPYRLCTSRCSTFPWCTRSFGNVICMMHNPITVQISVAWRPMCAVDEDGLVHNVNRLDEGPSGELHECGSSRCGAPRAH